MPYVDINSGIIHLDAEITYENTVNLLATIRQMEHSSKVSHITLHITSHGGALMPSVAIVQTLRTCSKKVATVGSGYVASAAVPILAAGTEGCRSIVEGTKLLIHQPTNMLAETSRKNPNIDTWKQEVTFLENIMDQYYWTLGKCTTKQSLFWKDILGDKPSRFISEDEATQWGLIDKVLPLSSVKHEHQHL